MINTSETRESRRVLLPTHASCSLSTESNMIKYGVSSNTKMRKEWLKTYQITCLRSTFSPLPPSRSVLIRDQTLSSMIYSSLFEFLFFFFFFLSFEDSSLRRCTRPNPNWLDVGYRDELLWIHSCCSIFWFEEIEKPFR